MFRVHHFACCSGCAASSPPTHTHPLTPQIRTTVLLQRSQGEKKGRRRRLGCRRGVFAGSSSFLMEGFFGYNSAILRAVVCVISRKKPTLIRFPKQMQSLQITTSHIITIIVARRMLLPRPCCISRLQLRLHHRCFQRLPCEQHVRNVVSVCESV